MYAFHSGSVGLNVNEHISEMYFINVPGTDVHTLPRRGRGRADVWISPRHDVMRDHLPHGAPRSEADIRHRGRELLFN